MIHTHVAPSARFYPKNRYDAYMAIDDINHQIITLLRRNSRLTATEIARMVHRSRAAVTTRIDALIAAGEIIKFSVILKRNPYPVLFEITLKSGVKCEMLIAKLEQRYTFTKAWSVTGTTDLLIWAEVISAATIHEMRNYLLEQPEVQNISTRAVTRTFD